MAIDMNRQILNRYQRDFKASFVVRILIIILMPIFVLAEDWFWFTACFLMIFVSFFPSILQRNYKTTIPWQLDLLMASAILLHFGGEAFNVYGNIPNYDVLTHFVSSIFFSFLAFVIIFIFNEYGGNPSMNSYSMAFVVIIFTMAVGVMWEFLEWLSDYFLGSTLQLSVDDTIKDLFVDTIGGLIMGIIGVYLIKKGKLKSITNDFGEQMNQNIINKTE